MNEQQEKPKVILTDSKVLHKIKYLQFRRQIIPILMVVALMVLHVFWAQSYTFYITMAAFAWYLWERIKFRTKNKILVPDAGTFVSPVNGKIQVLKHADGITQISMRKSFLDVIELRLPYPDLKMENNRNWIFETPKGQVNLRIQSERITFFENTNEPGKVIGVLPGSSIITVNVPSSVKVLVKAGQPVFGGETVLFSLAEDAEEAPKTILVEEPIEELNDKEDV
jgi:hypothetical protein